MAVTNRGIAPDPADMLPVKTLQTSLDPLPAIYTEASDASALRLNAVSSRFGTDLLSGLMDAVDRGCGWILHRQMASASALLLHVETQGRALQDLYFCLLEEGLELSRESHRLLSERCLCAHLHGDTRRSIVSLHLYVSMPAEPPSSPLWEICRPA